MIDLMEYFSEVLEGDGELIGQFIFDITDQYGADALEWQYEDGMYEMNAGVIGVIFYNPLDTVFFKQDIGMPVYPE